MSGRSGRRGWVRRAGLLAGAGTLVAALAVGAVWSYDAARDMGAFRVDRVEVHGVRYLAPYAVVRAAGLDRDPSLLDRADRWRAGIRTLALVEEVRVRRRLPSTVVIEIVESEPVALVGGSTLRPVDRDGRLLELDPAGLVLDLPVVTGLETDGPAVAAGASGAAIATVSALLEQAPEVARRLAQAELRDGSLHVGFRGDRARAVLPAAASPTQLMQLRVTLADLLARGELDRVRTIDVRFRDQVVVSFLDRRVS